MAVALLVIPVVLAGLCRAEEDDGSGDSYWGEIPAENADNSARLEDSDRPLWEDIIYYPYQLFAIPVRVTAAGLGAATAWASDPVVYGTARDIVTLSFIPIDGSVGVSAGGADGLGVSYELTHGHFLGPDNRFKLGLGRTTGGKSKATVGLMFGEGHRNVISLGLGYRLKTDSRYFGLGYDSSVEDESYFTSEVLWLGADYRRLLVSNTFVELEGLYSAVAARNTSSYGEESIAQMIPVATDRPTGYGNRSTGYTASLGLVRDTTNDSGRPQRGGIHRARLSLFTDGAEGGAQYLTQRFEWQRFLPLWHTKRSLALRGLYTRLQSMGEEPIPFQRLMSNDDPDLLRGYRDLRFRDDGLVVFTAEYRFPAWNYRSLDGLGLDAYLFTDIGQVFDRTKEIALNNLTESYGIGLRWLVREGFSGRLEFGFSEEDTMIRLSAQQTFQYMKGGLLHGRDPIPRR
jgi:outer membrane protein assembly factor BamA